MQKKREQLHKILDLVLDINGLERRSQKITGNKPTAFVRYSGHINAIDIDVCKDGYDIANPERVNINAYVDEEFSNYPTLEEVIEKLELLKSETSQTAECKQCGKEGVKQDMLETIDGYTCEECMKEQNTNG